MKIRYEMCVDQDILIEGKRGRCKGVITNCAKKTIIRPKGKSKIDQTKETMFFCNRVKG